MGTTTTTTTTTAKGEAQAGEAQPNYQRHTLAQATKLGHVGLAQAAATGTPQYVAVGKGDPEAAALLALRTRRWGRRHAGYKCHVRYTDDGAGFTVVHWQAPAQQG